MYLIRRVYKTTPGKSRHAAEVLVKLGEVYQKAGQRSPSRVYTSGGTVPGPADTVYMDWTDEAIRSPHRKGNKNPDAATGLSQQLREFIEESHIEFYELVTPGE